MASAGGEPVDDRVERAQRDVGTGRYALERLLGEGAMGEVFAASDTETGRPVVVKLLHGNLSEPLRERFGVEAQVLARLNHANIVRVLDHGAAGGRPYLVMERLYGRPLDQALKEREGWPSDAEASDVARQVLAGLAYVHERRIVHRDVKPANVFLCDDGCVKLLDFGVVKLLESLTGVTPIEPTKAGLAVGTPRYLSPEQALGRKIDARADIYGVGCLLYFMLARRAPFDHKRGVAEMLKAHLSEPARPPSAFAKRPIDPRLDAIVLKALSKSPGDRHQNAYELSGALLELTEQYHEVAEQLGFAAPPEAPLATQALPAIEAPPAETSAPSSSRAPQVAATVGGSLEAHAVALADGEPEALPRRVLWVTALASAAATAVIDLLARGL